MGFTYDRKSFTRFRIVKTDKLLSELPERTLAKRTDNSIRITRLKKGLNLVHIRRISNDVVGGHGQINESKFAFGKYEFPIFGILYKYTRSNTFDGIFFGLSYSRVDKPISPRRYSPLRKQVLYLTRYD